MENNQLLLPILAKSSFIKDSFVPNCECYMWYHNMKYEKVCKVYNLLNIYPILVNNIVNRYKYDLDLCLNELYKKLNKINNLNKN